VRKKLEKKPFSFQFLIPTFCFLPSLCLCGKRCATLQVAMGTHPANQAGSAGTSRLRSRELCTSSRQRPRALPIHAHRRPPKIAYYEATTSSDCSRLSAPIGRK
jgi:hypothetical protein